VELTEKHLVVQSITWSGSAADGRGAIRCSQVANRSISSLVVADVRRPALKSKIKNQRPKSARAFSLRLLPASSVVAGSTWTSVVAMNPTPIPPARGACIARQLAGSPPGRGQGWVGLSAVHFSFQTCSPLEELWRGQGGLHTWCRRRAGTVACSAGVLPAELFFNFSAGKMPVARRDSWRASSAWRSCIGTINRSESPSTALRAPSPPLGERMG